MNEKLHTVRELAVADWFPFKDGTIRKMIHSGRLRAINVSQGNGKPIFRIRKSVVDKFLQRSGVKELANKQKVE